MDPATLWALVADLHRINRTTEALRDAGNWDGYQLAAIDGGLTTRRRLIIEYTRAATLAEKAQDRAGDRR